MYHLINAHMKLARHKINADEGTAYSIT